MATLTFFVGRLQHAAMYCVKTGTRLLPDPGRDVHPLDVLGTMTKLLRDLTKEQKDLCLHTQTADVLEVMWVLQIAHEALEKTPQEELDVVDTLAQFFDVSEEEVRQILQLELKVFYITPTAEAVDISNLNPGSENDHESSFGHLSDLATKCSDVVCHLAVNCELA